MSRSPKNAPAGKSAKRIASSKRPTIHDVSRLAGVSRMTVSRVMRDHALVLPETRARVNKAIADLGYVPDRAAGSLGSRRTGFIALLLPTLTNANFSAVAHGLTEALREAEYHLLIAYTDYSLGEEERQLKNLLARRPEAIILTGAVQGRAVSRMLLATNIPVIEIADLPSNPFEHVVGFSNYQAGRTAARYLVEKGFKRIGAMASAGEGDVIDHRGEARMRGFEDELRLSGLTTDFVLRQGQAPVSFEHGAASIAILLERAPGLEAVFAVSDLSAVGAVMECQRRGVAVPGDLSIMGFGDFELAGQINPPLTTVHVDFRALGQRTGQLILELLGDGVGAGAGHIAGAGLGAGVGSGAGAARGPRIIDVGLSIVERESVKRG